ncbi:MAG: hypothetical protein Q4D06_09835 [Coriobacteriia bacterium]|nr:hypothetical protein [Coriobacteriia bacterium]
MHVIERIKTILKTGYFAPKTWAFWRTLIICFFVCNILGHGLEIVYCGAMNSLFGIIEDDYAALVDPWYVPYWVYGAGAVVMTLVLEPFKEHIIARRKTIWGALLQTFVIMVFLSMVLELFFGLLVNQPDPVTGLYPYWDNSQLPLNVFGQAWLVNDVFIGLAAMVYLWIVFPVVSWASEKVRPLFANTAFASTAAAFSTCCLFAYAL